MARPLYFPHQPKRCADGETGPAGHCLACGAGAMHACMAPPAERYQLPAAPRAVILARK